MCALGRRGVGEQCRRKAIGTADAWIAACARQWVFRWSRLISGISSTFAESYWHPSDLNRADTHGTGNLRCRWNPGATPGARSGLQNTLRNRPPNPRADALMTRRRGKALITHRRRSRFFFHPGLDFLGLRFRLKLWQVDDGRSQGIVDSDFLPPNLDRHGEGLIGRGGRIADHVRNTGVWEIQ